MIQKEKRVETYLIWILDAIEKIHFHTKVNPDIFDKNPTIIDACVMQLIHIGELINKISKIEKKFMLNGVISKE